MEARTTLPESFIASVELSSTAFLGEGIVDLINQVRREAIYTIDGHSHYSLSKGHCFVFNFG